MVYLFDAIFIDQGRHCIFVLLVDEISEDAELFIENKLLVD
jgi:hypothetical protein